MPRKPVFIALAILWTALVPMGALAETALVAVAANFAGAAEALRTRFADQTGHDLTLTTGSTGKLYAQIVAGAPFDVMLSADSATPARLISGGHAVAGSAFSYATGRLALWSAEAGRIGADGPAALKDPALRFVAIANPDLAPYGVAAREALQALDLWQALQPQIVMGQNIGQTHAMVASGAAEVGFVALSAIVGPNATAGGSLWKVPQTLHTPIRQDAVILDHGRDNAAARAFMDFLRSPDAAVIIADFGYDPDA